MKIRKSLVHVLSLLVIVSATKDSQAVIICQTNASEKLAFTDSKNVTIAFDVDKVLVDDCTKEKKYDYAKLWWSEKWKLLSLLNSPSTNIAIMNIVSWCYRHSNTHVEHETLKYIEQQLPIMKMRDGDGKSMTDKVLEIVRKGKPLHENIAVLKALREHGYSTAIATNRSRAAFDHLVDNKILPDYAHYSVIMTPDYNRTNEQQKLAKKPYAAFYNNLKTAVQQKNPNNSDIIFIDDQMRYVKGACKSNITTIHYNTTPASLKDDLRSLGIKI